MKDSFITTGKCIVQHVYVECDKWCLCFIVIMINKFYCKVRDEYRTDYDEGRGGYGKIVATKITQARDPMWLQTKNQGQPICVDHIDLRNVLVESFRLKLIRGQSTHSFQRFVSQYLAYFMIVYGMEYDVFIFMRLYYDWYLFVLSRLR